MKRRHSSLPSLAHLKRAPSESSLAALYADPTATTASSASVARLAGRPENDGESASTFRHFSEPTASHLTIVHAEPAVLSVVPATTTAFLLSMTSADAKSDESTAVPLTARRHCSTPRRVHLMTKRSNPVVLLLRAPATTTAPLESVATAAASWIAIGSVPRAVRRHCSVPAAFHLTTVSCSPRSVVPAATTLPSLSTATAVPRSKPSMASPRTVRRHCSAPAAFHLTTKKS